MRPRIAPIRTFWDLSTPPDPITISTRAIEGAPGEFELLPVDDPRPGIGATSARVTVSSGIGTNSNTTYVIELFRPGVPNLDISKTITALGGATTKSETLSSTELSGADAIQISSSGSADSGVHVWVDVSLDFGE